MLNNLFLWLSFSVPDCRNNPGICDSNASCESTGILIKNDWILHTCQCNTGYFGNGIDCISDSEQSNYADDLMFSGSLIFWNQSSE